MGKMEKQPNGSNWRNHDAHDGFERLSTDIYCVNFGKEPETIGLLEKIGIRKFGSDRMMIDEILIKSNQTSIFQVNRWIKTHAKEYIFELDYGHYE